MCRSGGHQGPESGSCTHELQEVLGSFADAKGQVAGVGGDLTGEVEEGEPQLLGARSGQGGWQGKGLHRAEHVVGQHREPVPSGVGTEVLARRSGAEFVLGDVVNVLDGARLLPMPPEQVLSWYVTPVGDDGKELLFTAGGEQKTLSFPDPDGDIAKRSCVLGPIAGGELDVGAAHGLVGTFIDQLPLLLRDQCAGMVQLGGHVGADGEADVAGGTVVSCIVSEPSKHAVLVACTVGAEEQLGHRSRQRLEAASDQRQVVHASGDVAVTVLVGDDEVLLRPVHGDGLVSNASLVVGHGLLLVAFLDGGVVVERCGLAVALSGNGVTQSGVDCGEGYELFALGGDDPKWTEASSAGRSPRRTKSTVGR